MAAETLNSPTRVSTAAYAVAAAFSLGCASLPSPAEARAVERIEQYCTKSWQNAGIASPEWQDCTQEVFAQLLTDVERDRLDAALADPESQERRLLKRAIWRTVQRWRRAKKPMSLVDNHPSSGPSADVAVELADAISHALELLSDRQQRILVMWSEGWNVSEIAAELNLSAARVSDEKYKSLHKLRNALAEFT